MGCACLCSRRLQPLPPLVRPLSVASSSSDSSVEPPRAGATPTRAWSIIDASRRPASTSSSSSDHEPARRPGVLSAGQATRGTEHAHRSGSVTASDALVHGTSLSTAQKKRLKRGPRASSEEPRGSGVLSTARQWSTDDSNRVSASSRGSGVLSSKRPPTDAERRQAELSTPVASAAAPAPGVDSSSRGPARELSPGVGEKRKWVESTAAASPPLVLAQSQKAVVQSTATPSDRFETGSGPGAIEPAPAVNAKTKGKHKHATNNTTAPAAKTRQGARGGGIGPGSAGAPKSANAGGKVCKCLVYVKKFVSFKEHPSECIWAANLGLIGGLIRNFWPNHTFF